MQGVLGRSEGDLVIEGRWGNCLKLVQEIVCIPSGKVSFDYNKALQHHYSEIKSADNKCFD